MSGMNGLPSVGRTDQKLKFWELRDRAQSLRTSIGEKLPEQPQGEGWGLEGAKNRNQALTDLLCNTAETGVGSVGRNGEPVNSYLVDRVDDDGTSHLKCVDAVSSPQDLHQPNLVSAGVIERDGKRVGVLSYTDGLGLQRTITEINGGILTPADAQDLALKLVSERGFEHDLDATIEHRDPESIVRAGEFGGYQSSDGTPISKWAIDPDATRMHWDGRITTLHENFL